MTLSNLVRLCLSLGLAVSAGCFASHSVTDDECEAVRSCFATDREGCCGETTLSVSVCEACPAGYAERAACPTSGCGECESSPQPGLGAPLDPGPVAPGPRCYEDLGGGCCGDAAMWVGDACGGSCPLGTRPADSCSGFGEACGCPDGESDRDAFRPAVTCMVDLGGACCGDVVSPTACGDCPRGSIPAGECLAVDGGERPVPGGGAGDVAPGCYQLIPGGCCGDFVGELNYCGTCPEGSVPSWACDRCAFGGGA